MYLPYKLSLDSKGWFRAKVKYLIIEIITKAVMNLYNLRNTMTRVDRDGNLSTEKQSVQSTHGDDWAA